MYYINEKAPDLVCISSTSDLQEYTECMLSKIKEFTVKRIEFWLLSDDTYTVSKLIHTDDLMNFKFVMDGRMFNGTHLIGGMLDERVEDFVQYDVKKIAIGCIMDFMAEQFGEDFL